jgi:hypothetical protein
MIVGVVLFNVNAYGLLSQMMIGWLTKPCSFGVGWLLLSVMICGCGRIVMI